MIRRLDYRMGKVAAVLILCTLCGCADIREARRAQDPEKRRPGERTVSADSPNINTALNTTNPRSSRTGTYARSIISRLRENFH